MTEKLVGLEEKKEESKLDYEKLQDEYLNLKDEPTRIGKGNENQRKGVEHLRSDME